MSRPRTNYRPRRRRRGGFSFNNIKIYAAIGILVILIVSVAYRTCQKNKQEQRQSQLAGDVETAKLAEVLTPDITDGQMLHYPGFDILFSPKDRQPYYAAWILTPENARATTHGRSNNFRPDPDVPQSAQLADYRGSGYDRGHMAPSADMRYSHQAQEACFFLTNMCPQDNQLNAKAWANLEEQCRAWAQRDSTIIIVAGPILSDRLTETIGPDKVTVPDRFFKVVLAPYANPPRAIGFIMPNGYVPGGVQMTATTVDQVEEITGFDFFSALPDELENQIEATAKYSSWQYSKKRRKK